MKANGTPLIVAGLNTLGLLVYLLWISTAARGRLFYTQEGVLFLLPCIPFFLVYIMIFKKPETETGVQLSSSSAEKTGEEG